MIKISDIKDSTFLLGLLALFFLLCPGLTVIFLYDMQLFLNLDWIKLILLAVCIHVPILLLSLMFVMLQKLMSKEKQSIEPFDFAFEGLMFSAIAIYTMPLIAYFQPEHKIVKIYLLGISSLFMLVVVLMVISFIVTFMGWLKRKILK